MKPSKKRRISGLHSCGCSECATSFVPSLWFCILPLELTLKQNNALCAENQACKTRPSPLDICLLVTLDSSLRGNTMQSLQIRIQLIALTALNASITAIYPSYSVTSVQHSLHKPWGRFWNNWQTIKSNKLIFLASLSMHRLFPVSQSRSKATVWRSNQNPLLILSAVAPHLLGFWRLWKPTSTMQTIRTTFVARNSVFLGARLNSRSVPSAAAPWDTVGENKKALAVLTHSATKAIWQVFGICCHQTGEVIPHYKAAAASSGNRRQVNWQDSGWRRSWKQFTAN